MEYRFGVTSICERPLVGSSSDVRRLLGIRMDGRMDGRTDERTDGWTDGRTDGRRDGRTDARTTDGRTDGWRTADNLVTTLCFCFAIEMRVAWGSILSEVRGRPDNAPSLWSFLCLALVVPWRFVQSFVRICFCCSVQSVNWSRRLEQGHRVDHCSGLEYMFFFLIMLITS